MQTKIVKKILRHYDSENSKVKTGLTKLLNYGALAGTGKMVILPVDQGFEHGPFQSFAENPPAFDPEYHLKLAEDSGCNAYAAPYGFLKSVSKKAKIPLILKANNSDSLYKPSDSPLPAMTAQVEQALELNCTGIGFTIYPGSSKRNIMYEQIAQAGCLAKKHGLVLVIWAYPRGGGISKKGETALDVIAYSAHIAAQMGAHIIKVKPPSDFIEQENAKNLIKNTQSLSERVRWVIKSAFNGKRIVIFSGGPAKEKQAVLTEIKDLAKGGAFGSIVGRNAFKRPFKEGQSLLKEIINIYKTTEGF